jgi:hypothetical protein
LTGNSGSASGIDKQIHTDSDGQFVLDGVPTGEYELRIAPERLHEISAPVRLILYEPLSEGVCQERLVLTIHFTPTACVIPEVKTRASVSALIEQMLSSSTEAQAFGDLEALGCAAVPEIIEHMNDRRELPDDHISLRNKSRDAWESMRHYQVNEVIDALDAILNQLTGQTFGYIDPHKNKNVVDAERDKVVRGWNEWLKSTPRTKPCAGG